MISLRYPWSFLDNNMVCYCYLLSWHQCLPIFSQLLDQTNSALPPSPKSHPDSVISWDDNYTIIILTEYTICIFICMICIILKDHQLTRKIQTNHLSKPQSNLFAIIIWPLQRLEFLNKIYLIWWLMHYNLKVHQNIQLWSSILSFNVPGQSFQLFSITLWTGLWCTIII